MRKILAIGLILVMVVIGFTAMVNPVASDDCVTIEKDTEGTCHFGALSPGLWDNDNVPLGTFVAWELKIEVTNNLGYPIENAMVYDRLGAELMLLDWDEPGEVPPEGPPEDITPKYISPGTSWTHYTKGNSEKVFIVWDIGDLADGQTVTLVIAIGTDMNPAGKQEYTSTGDYWLNSGATLKYYDTEYEHQDSLTSNQIPITVVDW